MSLYRVKGYALPVSSERPFVQIECQYAETLLLMIPQAVVVLICIKMPGVWQVGITAAA